jgi:hypothetical protein
MPYLSRAVFALLGIILVFPAIVHAAPGDYQRCSIGSTCIVGEYFFDDNSLPITTGATCTLNSFDPSSDPHFVNQALTPTADGWYAHSFSTSGYTKGVYRGTLCCSYQGDNLCIDKSFQIVNESQLTSTDIENAVLNADLANHTATGSVGQRLNNPELTSQNVTDAVWDADTADYNNPGTFGSFLGNLNNLSASDIWSYSNRSLSSFGSLSNDIWSHSSRTLTGFGSLVSNIWDNTPSDLATESDINNQTTTLEGSIAASYTDLSTLLDQINNLSTSNSEELQQLSRQIQANSLYLENLTKTAIIKNGNNSVDSNVVEKDLVKAQDYLTSLYANTQQIVSRLGLLLLNWDTLTDTQIETELTYLLSDLGTDPTQENYQQSVLFQLAWFKTIWPNPTTITSYTTAQSGLTNLEKSLNQVDVSGKSNSTKELIASALTQLESLENLIGNISSVTSDQTLNGLTKLISNYLTSLSDSEKQLDNLLTSWNSYSYGELDSQLGSIETQILSVNQIPKVKSLLVDIDTSNPTTIYNRALGLKAIIHLNQQLWSNQNNLPFHTNWLEIAGDKVAFRSAVYNPSSDQSQSHTLQYYLPKELTEADILSREGELSTQYNPDEELVSITGNYNLKPQALTLQQIITNDFWNFSDAELELIKNQTDELVKSLEKTSYASQGVTLQTEITASLKKITETQTNAITPLDRISTYRSNLVEMDTILQKMLELKNLSNLSQSTNSLTGFVGGIQAVSVWGIILIVIAGFVFLTIYMKKLMASPTTTPPSTAVGQDVVRTPNLTPTLGIGLPFIHADQNKLSSTSTRSKKHDRNTRMFHMLFVALTTTALAGMLFGSISTKASNNPQLAQKQTIDNSESKQDSAVTPTTNTTNSNPHMSSTPIVLGQSDSAPSEVTNTKNPESNIQYWINPPSNSAVNIREDSSLSAPVITKIINPTPVTIGEETESWTQITFTKNGSQLTGWVYNDFLTSNNPE